MLQVKKNRQNHQAEELLVAAMQGDLQLLEAMRNIKKGRGSGNMELPDAVGNAVGQESIAEMFKNSYEELYNSSPSVQEMAELRLFLNENIAHSESAATEVNKVTWAVVKEAVAKLKPKKSDVTGSYVSDALKMHLIYSLSFLLFTLDHG